MNSTRAYAHWSPVRQQLVSAVNELLALESGSLIQRLRESEPYVPADAAEQALAVQEMVAEDARHTERLGALLDRLDATPGPRGVRIDTGDLHYNQIRTLIPRLIADQKRLLTAYESAQRIAANEPLAADVLSGLAASHRAHLSRLDELAAK